MSRSKGIGAAGLLLGVIAAGGAAYWYFVIRPRSGGSENKPTLGLDVNVPSGWQPTLTVQIPPSALYEAGYGAGAGAATVLVPSIDQAASSAGTAFGTTTGQAVGSGLLDGLGRLWDMVFGAEKAAAEAAGQSGHTYQPPPFADAVPITSNVFGTTDQGAFGVYY
jgi:hypothetical protein